MPFRIIFACLLILVALPCRSDAQASVQRYVYRVITHDTRYSLASGRSVYQTGFLMRGTRGILTTLHGVVVGTKWSAINENGEAYTNLEIEKIDVSHDLVLLSSPALKKRVDGLSQSSADKVKPLQLLRVFGHPAGISLYIKHPTAGDPPIIALKRLIPPTLILDFIDRHSPSINSKILSLEGKLGPGESGAPVLDNLNRVVAVADGGLGPDFGSISWAIPITNMSATLPKSRSQITGIFSELSSWNRTSNGSTLFAFSVVTDQEKLKKFNLEDLVQDIKAHENLPLTRYEVAAVLYHDIFLRLPTPTASVPLNSFTLTDIRKEDVAYDAIKSLLAARAVKARRASNNTHRLELEFSPDEEVDRYHLAALIYNFLNNVPSQEQPNASPQPSPNSEGYVFSEFPDVPFDNWAFGYIDMLGVAGIWRGMPDRNFVGFRPATYKDLKPIVSRILEFVKKQ